MTLSFRNSLLAVAFSVLLLVLLGYSILSGFLVWQEGWSAVVGPSTLIWIVLESGVALVVSLVGFVLIRRSYRRSGAPELFFFAFFLLALAAEGLLVIQAWILIDSQPSWYSAALTRIIWTFRVMGLILLFCGSLFRFDFPYRKYGNLVAGSLVVGTFVAILLPLHSTTARNRLLFAVGDLSGLGLVATILVLVTGTNYVLGAFRMGAEKPLRQATSALCFLVAWTICTLWTPWGALLALPGALLAGEKSENDLAAS